MIERKESNYHGRSHARREKLPPIPERVGRSPVRRRMPARNADAAEGRNDRPTTAFSAPSDRTSMKPIEMLSVPSMPSSTYLHILPPAHLDESASTLTVELGDTTFNTVSNHANTNEPNIRNGSNDSIVLEPEKLSDAITPSIRNISRKHISTVVGSSCDDAGSVSTNQTGATLKNYAPEPTWMDFRQSSIGATLGTTDEPPELSSIPTDEIIDSFVESTTAVESLVNDDSSKEMMVNNISRETRDQYQLERLQARIDQRREMQSMIIYEERGAPNYKTLRSSRIKSVRNLYNSNPSIIQHQECFSHVSIANTKSTVPSLEHGHKISPSMASSVSVLRSSLCDTELSEYRGKAFTEMLQLLMNNPSLNKDSQLANATNLDSIAQNLVELEMSRILHDFEQNNSLIEKSCTAASNAIASSARSDRTKEYEPPEECTKTVEDYVLPPEKITFNDIGISITSKLSDVTSLTYHDGFELDEIIPPPHHRTTTNNQRNILPNSPSPVAAAAASVAASMISASGGNKKYGDTLPSVLEFPERNELDASDEHDITKDSGVTDNIESPRNVQHPTSALFKTITNEGGEDTAKCAAEEVTFHDEILSAVANDAEELMEVISILSKYEEAELMSKKKVDQFVGVLPFDELGPSKKVTFFEPLQQGPTCGCVIQ